MPNKKLNLGAGANWQKDGWDVLDHSLAKGKRAQAWDMPYENERFDVLFTSHMIEHISHCKIEETIVEINRVMRPGGILRILTPDLRKIAEAYVNGDRAAMDTYIAEDGSGIRYPLGLGQAMMNFIVSNGFDNIVLSSDMQEALPSYAHVFCYDFEMLSGLLSHYGFTEIRQCDVGDSAIEDVRELRTAAYDRDRNHSLVVECRKSHFVPFEARSSLMRSGPYDWEITRAYMPLLGLNRWLVDFLHGECGQRVRRVLRPLTKYVRRLNA